MSVLSMVAFRMVTQEGLRKCLKIYEELKKSGSEKATTTTTVTMIPDTHDAKSSANSRSAKRRIRRRKLQESRRRESKIEMKEEGEDTKESHESDHDNVDMTPYNLVTHANKRTKKDFLERSLMAAFLLRCLQRVGFFAHPTSDDGTYRHFTLQRASPFLLPFRTVFNLEIIGKNVLARAEDQLSIQQILRSRAMKP